MYNTQRLTPNTQLPSPRAFWGYCPRTVLIRLVHSEAPRFLPADFKLSRLRCQIPHAMLSVATLDLTLSL